MTPITLWELNNKIRSVIESNLDDTYWITGELSEARQASNGHFYGELIQKDENGRNVIARARVNCWAQQYNLIRLRFLHETGQEIRAGLKVLLEVQVTFHEQYGYALKVTDIDSTYTLGDLARRRKEILNKLEEEGILHDNQTLTMHRLTWRIAIVSAETAAGYGDFCDQLLHNEYGLRFQIKLFPATMQGQHVEESVSAALFQIASEENNWDAVVIIRGGGSTSDLNSFDSYELGANIAQFPLPVITGIGHDRDVTIPDMVSKLHVKTPTAAAQFLVHCGAVELDRLNELASAIVANAREAISHSREQLSYYGSYIPVAAQKLVETSRLKLGNYAQAIPLVLKSRISNERARLDRCIELSKSAVNGRMERERMMIASLSDKVQLLSPQNTLNRGYSLTTHNGHVVTNVACLKPGEHIVTMLKDGEISSIVE